MMRPSVLLKAEKQLQLLLRHRRQFTTAHRSVVLHHSHKLTIQRNGGILRCFASVPQPPVEDKFPTCQQPSTHNFNDCDSEEMGHGQKVSRDPQNEDCLNYNEGKKNHRHIPVMANEVLSCLEPKDDQLVVDLTFGAGGHARRILTTAPCVRYVAVDRDPLAFDLAQKLASDHREWQITPLLSKFSELPNHLEQLGIHGGSVDCFVMDLGVSSMQFDTASRGFGLSQDGPLDMRMDGQGVSDSPTAADVINSLEPQDLARIIKKYGEEKKATAIAHAIVEARYAFGPVVRTKQLADIIKSVFESNFRHDKLHRQSHVATKTFQALRIFVNDELNQLHNGLEVAHHYLKPGGRCAVISFHSLEDRIVKRHFHGIDMDIAANASIHDHFRNSTISYDNDEIKEKFLLRGWQPLRRKIIEATEAEISRNPRARSAKLRAAIKVKD